MNFQDGGSGALILADHVVATDEVVLCIILSTEATQPLALLRTDQVEDLPVLSRHYLRAIIREKDCSWLRNGKRPTEQEQLQDQ